MSISTRDSADPPFDLDGSSETDCQYDHLLQRPYEKAGLHREYKKRSVTTLIRRVFHHLKWPLLFSTQSIVIFLLARALLAIKGPGPIPGRELHGLVPEFPYEAKTFMDNLSEYSVNFTSEAASLEVRERWRNLLPKGSGWIHVDNPEQYPYLLHPFSTRSAQDVYLLSWVHQLHCLYMVMDSYDSLVQFGPDGTEREPEEGHGSIHVNHCFDYLRQAILCNMDSTLEGSTLDHGQGTSGWFVSHTCRNYEHGKAWAESLRQGDIQLLLHEKESRMGNGGVRPSNIERA